MAADPDPLAEVQRTITRVEEEIEQVNVKIAQVEEEIVAAKAAKDKEEVSALRKEKEQLRGKEKQLLLLLREEKKQLRKKVEKRAAREAESTSLSGLIRMIDKVSTSAGKRDELFGQCLDVLKREWATDSIEGVLKEINTGDGAVTPVRGRVQAAADTPSTINTQSDDLPRSALERNTDGVTRAVMSRIRLCQLPKSADGTGKAVRWDAFDKAVDVAAKRVTMLDLNVARLCVFVHRLLRPTVHETTSSQMIERHWMQYAFESAAVGDAAADESGAKPPLVNANSFTLEFTARLATGARLQFRGNADLLGAATFSSAEKQVHVQALMEVKQSGDAFLSGLYQNVYEQHGARAAATGTPTIVFGVVSTVSRIGATIVVPRSSDGCVEQKHLLDCLVATSRRTPEGLAAMHAVIVGIVMKGRYADVFRGVQAFHRDGTEQLLANKDDTELPPLVEDQEHDVAAMISELPATEDVEGGGAAAGETAGEWDHEKIVTMWAEMAAGGSMVKAATLNEANVEATSSSSGNSPSHG